MSKKMPGPPSGEHYEFALRFRHACALAKSRIGETQKELAKAFGVQPTAIHDWRHGTKLPAARTAIRVATILGVSFDWLMTGRGDPNPAPSPPAKLAAQQIEQLDAKSRQILEAMLNAATTDRSHH